MVARVRTPGRRVGGAGCRCLAAREATEHRGAGDKRARQSGEAAATRHAAEEPSHPEAAGSNAGTAGRTASRAASAAGAAGGRRNNEPGAFHGRKQRLVGSGSRKSAREAGETGLILRPVGYGRSKKGAQHRGEMERHRFLWTQRRVGPRQRVRADPEGVSGSQLRGEAGHPGRRTARRGQLLSAAGRETSAIHYTRAGDGEVCLRASRQSQSSGNWKARLEMTLI